ncbi:tape measure protein [Microbacterium oxydans]|uniref:tape measure protein n=1 Tax=Microbacterium oxydans TaxID=82380 RepID=UPI0024ADED51|nr:tape measure protein [Microbacterium oxydans]
MAGVEIAQAYIQLQPKFTGVKGEISSALGASDVQSAVAQSGSSMGDKLLAGLGKTLKVGALAVGGVLAAGIGTALVKGFDRMKAIDEARAKLTGLGNDTKTVDTIMKNALASVKGTAFGLGAAATVAAQAVAAGIKPGRDLEGVLKSVANSAAAAGTDLGDMGSIYAKVASLGKAQNDVLQQVADRGIPIYATLSKQLGVTTDEVFKMASAGKIGFAEFEQAMTTASGTVAAEMGSTFTGRFDNMMAALGRFGEGILSGIFPKMKDGLSGLTDALDNMMPTAKSIGDVLGNIVGFIVENVNWLGPLAGGLAAGTAAMWAFNVAANANPIGLIITAIGLLVGAVVALVANWDKVMAWIAQELPWLAEAWANVVSFVTTIWQEFTQFLGEAWTNITGFFTSAWEDVIQPVFKAIGDIATWLYENVLKPVFDGISTVVGFVAGMFKLQFDLIVNAFRLVGAIANWLWVNAIQPAFQAIGAVVSWLWTTIIQPYINGWATLFKWLWETVLSPVFGFIGSAVQAIGAAFDWLFKNVVQPVWSGISNAIKSAWDWINTYVFTPFKIGIDLIGQAFANTAKAIGTAWDGIKQAAAVPINFVLDTVWNNGLRSFWNDMVGTLGLADMKLPKAPLVKFASGGVMPGYTPGRDVHQFWSPTAGGLALSGGEAIMRPEFTRLVGGPAGVDALNAAARNGRLPIGDGEGNFFGDAWDAISKAASVAWEFLSNPAQAIKSHVIDGIIRPMMGDQNIFGKTVGGLAEKTVMGFVDLFKQAAPKGVGTKGMGWEAMWNVVRSQVPGAVKTSDFRPGAKTVNGGQSYHSLGRAIDIVPASMATFDAVAKLFPNASELIYTPAGNRQLQNGKPFAGWSDAVKKQHYNHVHLAMASGGVVPKLYDQGGWLPHGGMGLNLTGKPEAVLTPDESAALRGGLSGIRPGDRVVFEIEGMPLTAVAKRVIGAKSTADAVAFSSGRTSA